MMRTNKNLNYRRIFFMLIIAFAFCNPSLLISEEIPKDKEWWMDVAKKINKIERISDLKELVVYLDDKEPRIRMIAAEKIGDIGDENAIRYLEKKDSCWYVKRELSNSKKKIFIKKNYNQFIKQGVNKKQIVNKLVKDNPKHINIIINLFCAQGEIDKIIEISKNNLEIQTVLKESEFDVNKMQTKFILSKMSKNDKIKNAINLLVNWESVYQYEAAILTLIEIGNTVIPHVLKLLDDPKNIPTQNAPPWHKIHTTYRIILKVLESIPDERSIKILKELSRSKVEYVSNLAKESLEWVKTGVPYPFKYERKILIAEDDIPPESE